MSQKLNSFSLVDIQGFRVCVILFVSLTSLAYLLYQPEPLDGLICLAKIEANIVIFTTSRMFTPHIHTDGQMRRRTNKHIKIDLN